METSEQLTDVTASEKLTDINAVLAYLCEKFPLCFTQKGEIKPLKVGIFKDIAERLEGDDKVSKTQVRQALRKYTSHWRYLESVTKHTHRIDLDGQPAEAVEAEHVEHANTALEASRAKLEERKKQMAAKRPRKPAPRAGGRDGEARNSDRGERKPFNKTSKPFTPRKDAPAAAEEAAPAVKRTPGKLTPLAAADVKLQLKVKVKLGKALVNGVITDINKDEIHVQLGTGMVVKTNTASLYVL